MKKDSLKKIPGFTLMEVTVALAVFLILLSAIGQVFGQAFASYRHSRALQRDIENAQYALNAVTKQLRTSTIVSNPNATTVRFFDYSQPACLEYRIESNQLRVSKATTNFSGCTATTSLPAPSGVSTGVVQGLFQVVSSSPISPKRVGRVTIILDISEGPQHHARVQTSTSLRDYGYMGLQK